MCGACRVTVGGEVKFACVDGPEFDGHKVNLDVYKRQAVYCPAKKAQTKRAPIPSICFRFTTIIPFHSSI